MKITIHKTVFWSCGEREMTGKVKQVVGDHVVVASNGTDYMVRKSVCTLRSKKG